MSTTSMNIRMDADVKRQAQELFSEFGLDMTTAINVFLRQAIRERSLPFRVSLTPQKSRIVDDDVFFSGANLARLEHSLAQARAGKVTEHELIEVPDDPLMD